MQLALMARADALLNFSFYPTFSSYPCTLRAGTARCLRRAFTERLAALLAQAGSGAARSLLCCLHTRGLGMDATSDTRPVITARLAAVHTQARLFPLAIILGVLSGLVIRAGATMSLRPVSAARLGASLASPFVT
jgi:hypothetical protein